MALIPKRNRLNELLEDGFVIQERREYIGMSALMGKCKRRTWYNFRWAFIDKVPMRINRLFNRGHYEESVMLQDFRDIGIKTSFTGDNQMEFVDETGHIKGHPDGKLENVPGAEKTTHLFEGKTMKHSLYVAYLKQGLEKSNPSYWGQAHTYMGEWGLKRCVFGVVNKDTDERDFQRIEYRKDVHDECMSIGFDILTSERPPTKIGPVTWFECKFCPAKGICHKGEKINKTCRSCKHVNIEMEGKWSCGYTPREIGYDKFLTKDMQLAACEHYQLDEAFE